MARYTASPWGTIKGKISGSVGFQWKGIKSIREHGYPRSRGDIIKYDASDGGCARGIRFSAMQMNIRRAIFGMLGYLGRITLDNLMTPVWQNFCDKKKLKMTGIDLFMKKNARILSKSFDLSTLFSDTNLPDPTQMLISDGDLEPAFAITGANRGIPLPAQPVAVTITWSTVILRNGSLNDDVWLGVYIRPDQTQIQRMTPYGDLYIAQPGLKRSAASGIIWVPARDAADMTAFVFFNDACANYSPSVARQVV